ncbi:MAG: DUF5710 domain-containing protein [Rhodoferax sp.]|nr:DUF5710 domain-containing protein [Rhodoferax sp.]
MRINLVTPFAEKDQVKALGARWDSVRKNWYIVDVADLTPFARWIPDPVATTAVKAPVTTKSTTVVSHCGCNVLPWEDCAHTTTSGA